MLRSKLVLAWLVLLLWVMQGQELGQCSADWKGECQFEVDNKSRYKCCEIKQRKVLLDHDGGIDDFISLMIIQSAPNVELIGVSITPADCIPEDAVRTTQKLLSAFGNGHIPVSQGCIGGLHPFPLDFRQHGYFVQHLPDLINVQITNESQLALIPAHDFVANLLEKQEDKSVTVLMVGPATNLVYALKQCPICLDKIEEVVWMAGAVNVEGNVYDHYHVGHVAEWNAYWDPWASQQLTRFGLNVTLFPLDVSDMVPLTEEFLQKLANVKDKDLARLAGCIWSPVVGGMQSRHLKYFLWDTLATAYLMADNLVEMEMMEIEFSMDQYTEGQSKKIEGIGQWVQVAVATDANKVEEFILAQFSNNFP